MTIRWADYKDARSLAEVHVASWRDAYRGIIPDSVFEFFTIDRRENHFLEALKSQAEETALIEEEGKVAGFTTIGASRDKDAGEENEGEIWGIYISPDHWRKGYGRRLTRWAMLELGARGHKVVTLWVLEKNIAARKFYEAMGFTLDGATKEVRIGTTLKTVRYRKSINVN